MIALPFLIILIELLYAFAEECEVRTVGHPLGRAALRTDFGYCQVDEQSSAHIIKKNTIPCRATMFT